MNDDVFERFVKSYVDLDESLGSMTCESDISDTKFLYVKSVLEMKKDIIFNKLFIEYVSTRNLDNVEK